VLVAALADHQPLDEVRWTLTLCIPDGLWSLALFLL
jgi:hypothetical protein